MKEDTVQPLPQVLPKELEVSWGARQLWNVLRRMQREKDFCWPSQKKLASLLNHVATRTIRRWLVELRRLSLITWQCVKMWGRSHNHYRLCLPPPVDDRQLCFAFASGNDSPEGLEDRSLSCGNVLSSSSAEAAHLKSIGSLVETTVQNPPAPAKESWRLRLPAVVWAGLQYQCWKKYRDRFRAINMLIGWDDSPTFRQEFERGIGRWSQYYEREIGWRYAPSLAEFIESEAWRDGYEIPPRPMTASERALTHLFEEEGGRL